MGQGSYLLKLACVSTARLSQSRIFSSFYYFEKKKKKKKKPKEMPGLFQPPQTYCSLQNVSGLDSRVIAL
jgi:hypothetical protein